MNPAGRPTSFVARPPAPDRARLAAPLLLRSATLATPVGDLVLVFDAAGRLHNVDWGDHGQRQRTLLDRFLGPDSYSVEPARMPDGPDAALRAYFAGDLAAIDSVAVALPGTAFQRRVWTELRGVPAGQTISYAELARRSGRSRAIRAAGHANSLNPVSVVVPCHRIVGTNGALTGYGGGLARKRWLLRHEGGAGR